MSEDVRAHMGFFPLVHGENVSVSRGSSNLAVAKRQVEVHQGGANVIASGGSATVRQGGALVMAAGGDVTVSEGGAMVIGAGNSVRIEHGFAGVVLSPDVSLEDSRVLMGTAQAAALGAALGTVLLLGRALMRR